MRFVYVPAVPEPTHRLSPPKTKPKRQRLPVPDSRQVATKVKQAINAADLDYSSHLPFGSVVDPVYIEYPGTGCRESFRLLIPSKPEEQYNPLNDIYQTTQTIVLYCPEKGSDQLGDTRQGMLRRIIKACHKKSEDLVDALKEFNTCIISMRKSGAFPSELTCPAAGTELIYHVLEQAYGRSIAPDSHLLNDYQGFSNNVYGEIKASFVHDLIVAANIKPHHIFLDMGSGIGNVVLQVAAEKLCDSYGIEIMENPSKFAKRLKQEFLARMRYYAKPCGRVHLRQGDFLEDEDIQKVIEAADVIFVNNYAFDAELNQGILAKFLDLKENTKVISLKSFVAVGRQTNRRTNSIESIFKVEEYEFGRNKYIIVTRVSWMMEGGKYYIHTVDRSQMQEPEPE